MSVVLQNRLCYGSNARILSVILSVIKKQSLREKRWVSK